MSPHPSLPLILSLSKVVSRAVGTSTGTHTSHLQRRSLCRPPDPDDNHRGCAYDGADCRRSRTLIRRSCVAGNLANPASA